MSRQVDSHGNETVDRVKTTPSANIDNTVQATGPAVRPLTVMAAASQSADVVQFQDFDGTVFGGVLKTGYIYTARTTAPADAALAAGQAAFWLDATDGAGKLMVKAKTANGTVASGSITLS